MKEKKINTRIIQAMDFIAARLLNFKRIQFEEFCELVSMKFHIKQAETLFYELAQKEIIYICNGMVVACKEDALRLYCVAPALHAIQFRDVQVALS